jgi:hypothetical protein
MDATAVEIDRCLPDALDRLAAETDRLRILLVGTGRGRLEVVGHPDSMEDVRDAREPRQAEDVRQVRPARRHRAAA